jgi:hypothetical protein
MTMRIEPRPRDDLSATNHDAPPLPRARMTPARELAATLPLAETPDRLAFLANLRGQAVTRLDAAATPPSRDAIVGARLDALRDAFSGPYRIGGEQVTAPPMFRMNTGANDEAAAKNQAKLHALVGNDAGLVRIGRGTPAQLVKVTQALLDAGHLPPGPGDVATRIRAMQWQFGIGVDCAGYVYRAAEAATGAKGSTLGLKEVVNEAFRGLDGHRGFAKVSPMDARPGDVMTLDPLPPETVGHNVVVRSHAVQGQVHTLEVDSSWGAGADGADYGGFRRDTWLYDEGTKLWTSFDAHTDPPVARQFATGPCGERFHGCYRAKVER